MAAILSRLIQFGVQFRGVFFTSLIGLLLKLASPKIIATLIVVSVEWLLHRTKWKWLERVLFVMYDEWDVRKPDPEGRDIT